MSRLVARRADLSKSRPPRWAWRHRIVIGYLNLILGDEGVGKGTQAAWIIARLTRGQLPGDLKGKPISVGILGDEDSFTDVWVPRLYAAGANLKRVRQVERPDGGYVSLTEFRKDLGEAIEKYDLGFLYLDALIDNIGAGTDDWRAKHVRDALQPARSLARTFDIAVVGSLHPNKRGNSFRQLVAGSSAFNAVSRSSLLLAQHPDYSDKRVLVRGKGNLSKQPMPLEFAIESHEFEVSGNDFNVPRACRFGPSEVSVEDLIVATAAPPKANTQVGNARATIAALLPRDSRWHPSKPIFEACEDDGIETRTVKRAKQGLRIEDRRTQSFPSTVQWRWPSSSEDISED